MCLKIVLTFVLWTSREGYSNKTLEYDMSDLLGELSDQNAAALSSPEFDSILKNYTDRHPPAHPYEQFQPKALLRGREVSFWAFDNQVYYERWNLGWYITAYINQDHAKEHVQKTCFILSSIYQRARTDMLKYYKFRDFYVNTLEYEVGYLCHVIITKYMNMLELYEIVHYRYLSQPDPPQKMPVRFMFYIYINMVEISKAIIQYCNMLHEVEDKYEEQPIETHWDDMEGEVISTAVATITLNKHAKKLMNFMENKIIIQSKEKANRMRIKLIEMGLVGTTATKHPRPARYWVPKHKGVDYGWSIEEW